MPTQNSDTQNSDTLFALTKMSLFWQQEDFGKKYIDFDNTLTLSRKELIFYLNVKSKFCDLNFCNCFFIFFLSSSGSAFEKAKI